MGLQIFYKTTLCAPVFYCAVFQQDPSECNMAQAASRAVD